MDITEFKAMLKNGRGKFTLMCGARVAMSVSNQMRTWEGFVDQFAGKVAEVLHVHPDWIVGYRDKEQLTHKIEYVESQLNVRWTTSRIEAHRMIAQLILRSPSLDRRDIGEILHNLGNLILTTNYDTVIEDCVPHDRISISHVGALSF